MNPRLRRVYAKCVQEVERNLFSKFCNDFDYIVVDLPSIMYALTRPETFIQNLALAQSYGQYRAKFILVLDYSQDKHKPIAERVAKRVRDLGLEYVLAHNKPAEMLAAEIVKSLRERGHKAIVLSRDYDPLQIVDEMLQPVGARLGWIVRLVRVDRECVRKHIKRECAEGICQGNSQ